jgi:hypothetical protein
MEEIRNTHTILIIYKDILLSELCPSWSIGLLEKLIFAQIIMKFPAFHVTQSFITIFTRALFVFCV